MIRLEFRIYVKADDRTGALDTRDNIVDLLRDNGYNLVMTKDGLVVVMEERE